jgi:hypothetical protein
MSILNVFAPTTAVSFWTKRSILHSLVESLCTLIEQKLSELKIVLAGTARRVGAIADVIFVHGLAGDGQTTWQVEGDVSTFWPLWLSDQIININVWSLTYPAATLGWGNAGGEILLPDRAKTILDLLCSNGIGSQPILFVAHSLGGLLVKQLIRSASELGVPAWEQLAANVRGISFLATPHNGSGLAAFAKAISVFSPVTAQISHNDPYLRDLNEWFQQNANKKNIRIKTYFETRKTQGFIVVDASSANPGVQGCVPVGFDGNHLQICKPPSPLSPIYAGCCDFLEGVLKGQPAQLDSSVGSEDLQATVEASIANQYSFFTRSVAEDRLDLAEKLTQGDRAFEIPRALRFKEEFAKIFARNQLQTSATRHYLRVLAEIESRFNGQVYPAIIAGASRSAVGDLIRSKVSDPILHKYSSENLVDAVVVDQMIYYLTGLCHIRWSS